MDELALLCHCWIGMKQIEHVIRVRCLYLETGTGWRVSVRFRLRFVLQLQVLCHFEYTNHYITNDRFNLFYFFELSIYSLISVTLDHFAERQCGMRSLPIGFLRLVTTGSRTSDHLITVSGSDALTNQARPLIPIVDQLYITLSKLDCDRRNSAYLYRVWHVIQWTTRMPWSRLILDSFSCYGHW